MSEETKNIEEQLGILIGIVIFIGVIYLGDIGFIDKLGDHISESWLSIKEFFIYLNTVKF